MLTGHSDESALYGGSSDYGSYEALANLTVSIAGVTEYSNYKRTLDLETALHSANFTANGATFQTYAHIIQTLNLRTHAKLLLVFNSAPFPTKSVSIMSAPTSHCPTSHLASLTIIEQTRLLP